MIFIYSIIIIVDLRTSRLIEESKFVIFLTKWNALYCTNHNKPEEYTTQTLYIQDYPTEGVEFKTM